MKKRKIVWWLIVLGCFMLLLCTVCYYMFFPYNSVTDVQPETEIKHIEQITRNSPNFSKAVVNITKPEICIHRWKTEIISLKEALHCLDRYTRHIKQNQSNQTTEVN